MISIQHLTKSFGSNHVLRDVSLTLPAGSVLALLGPNGAGKTTLINILSTLSLPDAGIATIGGYDVVHHPEQVRSIISLTGQFAAVDDLLTGDENLRLLGRLWHLSPGDVQSRSQDLLDRLGLSDARSRLVKTYSGGMRRKLDLALSLLSQPQVLFLDEPTTGLDPRSRLALWEIVRSLAADGMTVFLTTQYLEEADYLADQIAVIDGGRIIATGTPAILKRDLARSQVILTIDAAERIPQAIALLGTNAAHDPAQPTVLRVPIDGPNDLRHLLDDLDRANISLTHVTLQEPTLDDVFFTLTGHSTQNEEAA